MLCAWRLAVAQPQPRVVPAPDSDRLTTLEGEVASLPAELAAERKARAEEQAQTRAAVRAEASAIATELAKRLIAAQTRQAAVAPASADPPAQASKAWTRGALRLTGSGFLQADAVLYRQDSRDEVDPSTGEPLNETRFLIRRARLDAQVRYRFLGAAVRLEGSTVQGPTARIVGAEAWVRFPFRDTDADRLPLVQLAIGLMKIPFGFEVMQYNPERLFLERSTISRALFPGDFDLGARAAGGVRFLRYALAAMNGDPVGSRGYPGRDPNQSKDLLGRLGIEVAPSRRVMLAGGVSGLYGTGFHRGTAATKDVLTWRDANGDGLVQLSELQILAGVAATPSQNFRRAALDVDLRVTATLPRLGALTLAGELVWAQNLDRGVLPADPVAVGRPLRELGGYVALTQELSRYAAIGVRYDRYNPDLDASTQLGAQPVPLDRSFTTLAVVLALRYPPWGRLSVQYDHNTNALGRTLSGVATTLGSDAVTLRAQVVLR